MFSMSNEVKQYKYLIELVQFPVVFTGPAGFNTPQVVGSGPRHIDIVWRPPLTPNGIITEYQIYQNGQFRESVSRQNCQGAIIRGHYHLMITKTVQWFNHKMFSKTVHGYSGGANI